MMQTMNDTDDAAYGALALAREWPALMFMAVVTVGLGIMVLVWPSETLTVVSVLLGLQILLLGIFWLISAFGDDARSPGLTAVVGILLIIGGIVVLRNPFETVTVLATILGVVWIVTGVVQIMESLANRRADHRLLRALSGLLSLGAGILVVAWPAPTLTVVAWIAGFYLVVFGLFLAATAFSMRSLTKA